MPKTDQRTLITTSEAAVLLGVDATTVQRRARRGILPGHKMPGRTGAYVFDRATIEGLAEMEAAS